MSESLQRLLSGLENVRADSNGHNARCPCHEDRENSLVIGTGEDGRLLIHCQAGCDWKQVVMAAGMTPAQLFPERTQREGGGWKVRTAYDYHDAKGNLVYQVCRLEPLPGEKKPFRQRRKTADGWEWGLKGVSKVLYRLPELLAADPARVVFVAEGEKDVDRLVSLGLVATCNPGGADSKGRKWLKSFCGPLKGRKVVLLPDNDPPNERGERPGPDFMRHVAAALADVAGSVRTLELPGLPPKGDVSDWLDAGGDKDELLRLAKAAEPGRIPPPDPVPAPDDPAALHYEKKMLAELGIDVLGETDSGAVKLFSVHHRKTVTVSHLRFLGYDGLLQGFGPVIKAKVRTDGDDPETYSLTQVKNAIGLVAGFTRLRSDNEAGPGIWRGKDERDDKPASIILVGAGEGAVLNGQPHLRRITQPRYGGLVLNLGDAEPWFQFDSLSPLVDNWNVEWSRGVVAEAEEVFSRWCWQYPDTDPALVTGLVLATWVQTIWRLRPQVVVSGKSNSGKSVLFDAISQSFGNLGVKSSDSSPAGIQQRIAHSAEVIFLDEFDTNKDRERTLKMLRRGSRGDASLKGTTTHKSVRFQLRHIVWVAAIDTGLQEEADMNRFINLQLVHPGEQKMGRLQVPPEWEMQALGQKLLAVAVKCAGPAMELAVRLATHKLPGINYRVIESYAVPAAMHAVATGASEPEAISMFHDMLAAHQDGEQSVESDEDLLVSDILETKIRYGQGGKEGSVASLIKLRSFEEDANEALERNGIVFPESEKDEHGQHSHVFLAHRRVSRHLLSRTRWEHHSIDEILERITGATKCRKRDSTGRQSRGVMVPLTVLNFQT